MVVHSAVYVVVYFLVIMEEVKKAPLPLRLRPLNMSILTLFYAFVYVGTLFTGFKCRITTLEYILC